MPYQSSLAHAAVTGSQASYGNTGQPPSAKAPAFVPRTKKPLVITDKDGNPIDITGGKKDEEKAEKEKAEKEKVEKEKAEKEKEKEKLEQERLAKEKLEEAEAAAKAKTEAE